MAELDDVLLDDALIEALAAGEHLDTYDPGDPGDTDPALGPLRALAGLASAAPVPEYDDLDPFALIDTGRHRRYAVRSLAVAVTAVATLSTSGVAAVVTGDPFRPAKAVWEQIQRQADDTHARRTGGGADQAVGDAVRVRADRPTRGRPPAGVDERRRVGVAILRTAGRHVADTRDPVRPAPPVAREPVLSGERVQDSGGAEPTRDEMRPAQAPSLAGGDRSEPQRSPRPEPEPEPQQQEERAPQQQEERAPQQQEERAPQQQEERAPQDEQAPEPEETPLIPPVVVATGQPVSDDPAEPPPAVEEDARVGGDTTPEGGTTPGGGETPGQPTTPGEHGDETELLRSPTTKAEPTPDPPPGGGTATEAGRPRR